MSERLARYVPPDAAGETWPRQLRTMTAESRRTPWKAAHEITRILSIPAVRGYFWMHDVAWGRGWHVYGLPVIQRTRGSSIAIGAGLEMRNRFASNPMGVHRPCLLCTWAPGAAIRIGSHVGMTGCTICAQTEVVVGSRVLLGANTVVVDTDFHRIEIDRRSERGASAPVVIEDDVFVGMQALILKGVRIGRGSVVGAGSVVTADVPSGVVVAGNPARVVRSLSDPVAPRSVSRDP